MTEQTTAVSLMRMALALLDREGMTVATCHLEQAIYTASDQGRDDREAPAHSLEPAYICTQVLTQQPKSPASPAVSVSFFF